MRDPSLGSVFESPVNSFINGREGGDGLKFRKSLLRLVWFDSLEKHKKSLTG
jgi:hypothetical protein